MQLNEGQLIIIVIVLVIVSYQIWNVILNLRKSIESLKEEKEAKAKIVYEQDILIKELISNASLELETKEAQIKYASQQWALTELEKFKNIELESLRGEIEKNATEAAANWAVKWRLENEEKIRQDAINRSYAVNMGKITEHLLPFNEGFPFNPRDTRFLGSPIDLVVFDGISDKKDMINIYFIEVKTGNSKLTVTQQRIKEAVERKAISWHELNPSDRE